MTCLYCSFGVAVMHTSQVYRDIVLTVSGEARSGSVYLVLRWELLSSGLTHPETKEYLPRNVVSWQQIFKERLSSWHQFICSKSVATHSENAHIHTFSDKTFTCLVLFLRYFPLCLVVKGYFDKPKFTYSCSVTNQTDKENGLHFNAKALNFLCLADVCLWQSEWKVSGHACVDESVRGQRTVLVKFYSVHPF